MPLVLENPYQAETPNVPDDLAFQTNDLATRAFDASKSRKNYESNLKKQRSKPIYNKIRQSVDDRSLTLYSLFTMAYFFIVMAEWKFSREIYYVVLPQFGFIFFIVCVIIGFWISFCFAESTERFRLYSIDQTSKETESILTQNFVNTLYNRKQKHSSKISWFSHPITGVILTVILLFGIYALSDYRTQLMLEAGEIRDSFIQRILPVTFYVLEIVFGIPTLYFLMGIIILVPTHFQTIKLTKLRDSEIQIEQTAINIYRGYMNELEKYNHWARKNQQPECHFIEPNIQLRKIFKYYTGKDPFEEENNNGKSTFNNSQNVPPTDDDPSTEMKEEQEQDNGHDEFQNIEDMYDESIHESNKGL